ncbi:GPP34 family phosphoprotein [bacterium]|nr:GPP34 family phosphoprotein [bacterium]
MTAANLFLHEEITLLALKEKEGTVEPNTSYTFALAGALLADLLLSKRIEIDERKKKKYISLADTTLFGDPLLDECIEKLRSAKKPKQIETWVSTFSGLKELRHRSALQLCRRGILKADEDKILHIFTRRIYPEIDPGPEQEVIERMRAAILHGNEDIDPRTVILISLAKSTDLLKVVFDKKDLKAHKKRIEQIVNGEIIGKAAKEAIEAVQAAVMVACMTPVIVAATASS